MKYPIVWAQKRMILLFLLYKHTVSSFFIGDVCKKFPIVFNSMRSQCLTNILLRHFLDKTSIFFIFLHHLLHRLPHTLKQTQYFVFIHILQYVYFRSMLQDYLSVTWIVFWNSMFLVCFLLRHHPKWKGLRHLQFSIHSQKVCSLYDSLSFFLLGNRIMYHLSMWINNCNKV